jgi:hypothetical protein
MADVKPALARNLESLLFDISGMEIARILVRHDRQSCPLIVNRLHVTTKAGRWLSLQH